MEKDPQGKSDIFLEGKVFPVSAGGYPADLTIFFQDVISSVKDAPGHFSINNGSFGSRGKKKAVVPDLFCFEPFSGGKVFFVAGKDDGIVFAGFGKDRCIFSGRDLSQIEGKFLCGVKDHPVTSGSSYDGGGYFPFFYDFLCGKPRKEGGKKKERKGNFAKKMFHGHILLNQQG